MKVRSMTIRYIAAFWLACASLTSVGAAVVSAQDQTFKVWPSTPPGRIAAVGEEADTSGPDGRQVAGKPVIRLGNVSTPTLTVYTPPADKNSGAAVLVCPGGGYNILAYDLEGIEVCQWLNSIGVTGVLLKYRVPRPEKDPRPIEPLQDAQRSMRLVRHQAAQLGIDPARIGVLGFSAGGNLAARLSTNYAENSYASIDDHDAVASRPDFSILIYPAYLFDKESESLLAADLPITSKTPPTFMTMAFDDNVGPENVLRYALALKQAEVPTELHLYPSGGHGFGSRRTDQPVTWWPDRCEEWMRATGLLVKQ